MFSGTRECFAVNVLEQPAFRLNVESRSSPRRCRVDEDCFPLGAKILMLWGTIRSISMQKQAAASFDIYFACVRGPRVVYYSYTYG